MCRATNLLDESITPTTATGWHTRRVRSFAHSLGQQQTFDAQAELDQERTSIHENFLWRVTACHLVLGFGSASCGDLEHRDGD